MMDAQDRCDLNARVERFLLSAGPLLRKHPPLFRQASAIFSSVVTNSLREPSAQTVELFSAGLGLPAAESPPPSWAARHFPFAKPLPSLWEQQHIIEAMLAPVADKRGKALQRQLKGTP